jgi:hypothetical protein
MYNNVWDWPLSSSLDVLSLSKNDSKGIVSSKTNQRQSKIKDKIKSWVSHTQV